MHRVRLADRGDAAVIGQLLYDFNHMKFEPIAAPY